MLSSINQMTSIDLLSKPVPQSYNKIEDRKPNSCSSTDSTNDLNPKKQKYIFENNNKSYAMYLILDEDKIKIRVDILPEGKEDYFYEKDITQEELKKINKVFKLFNNLEESFEYFNDIINKQNQITVKEENGVFVLEKLKMFSFPLKIEINKKFIENDFAKILQINIIINKNEIILDNKEIKDKNIISEEDKDKEDIIQLNIDNEELIKETSKNKIHTFLYDNKEVNDIIDLPEELEEVHKETEEENTKKSLLSITKIKSVPNLSEDKTKKNNSLLQRKRTINSDLSEKSFISQGNENDYGNNNPKKPKNLSAKANFLKIFSDNASAGSGESNQKFFVKIQKNLDLEKNKKKETNNINNIINNEKINPELNQKNPKDSEEQLLFGDDDSSEYINDDLDLLSNKSFKSPKMTPIDGKMNNIKELNENNFKLQNGNNYNNNQDCSKKNIENNSISKNYNKCMMAVENIQIKEGNKNNNVINNIYKNNESNNNYINKYENNNKIVDKGHNSYYINNSNSKKSLFYNKNNKPDKSFRIIHKNYIEYCTTEMSYLFGEEMNNSSSTIFSLESNLITNYSDFDFIINYLKTKFNKEIKNAIHIYQATEDGATAEAFHRICDGNTNVLVLIKTKDGKKFGGYTSVGFSNFNRSYHDDTAFLFSIDKREIYPNIRGKSAVDSFYNLGPCFSGDSIKIFDNFLMKEGITAKMSGNFEMNEEYQINCGKRTFEVEDIEVLEFIEMKNDDDNNI